MGDTWQEDGYQMWLADVASWYNALTEREREDVQRLILTEKSKTEFVTSFPLFNIDRGVGG